MGVPDLSLIGLSRAVAHTARTKVVRSLAARVTFSSTKQANALYQLGALYEREGETVNLAQNCEMVFK